MIVTRFAPSPTGRLHLGHAYSAVLGHAGRARAAASSRLRIEDLDPTRSRPEFVDGIFEDLRWLGLEWDEPVLVQSRAHARLCRQRSSDCARAASPIPASAPAPTSPQSLTAPHGDAATSYPGTCRGLPDDPERRATDAAQLAARTRPRRLRSPACPAGPKHDGAQLHRAGRATSATRSSPARMRRPPTISPCVVDDAASGVTTGRARRRPAPLDADPAPAPAAARPARADLSPPPARHARRRPPPRQARPRADARRDARSRRRRTSARGRPARRQASAWFRIRRRTRGPP